VPVSRDVYCGQLYGAVTVRMPSLRGRDPYSGGLAWSLLAASALAASRLAIMLAMRATAASVSIVPAFSGVPAKRCIRAGSGGHGKGSGPCAWPVVPIIQQALPRTAIKRWLWVVLQRQLNAPGDISPCQLSGQHKSKVHPSGHPTSAKVAAVSHDPLPDRHSAQLRQQVPGCPVTCRPYTVQQASSTQHE
jgi:hypothetical protein